MKTLFCSFCRTKRDRVFGWSADPEAYCICGNCLEQYQSTAPRKLSDTCCFCGILDLTGWEETDSGATICEGCLARFIKEKETPEPEASRNSIEEITIDWPVYFDATMDLISVKVKSKDGSLWSANFTTPPRILWEMEKGRKTGEWASGSYFCHPDLIFVEELTEDLIRKAVQDIWNQNRFEQVFRRDPDAVNN